MVCSYVCFLKINSFFLKCKYAELPFWEHPGDYYQNDTLNFKSNKKCNGVKQKVRKKWPVIMCMELLGCCYLPVVCDIAIYLSSLFFLTFIQLKPDYNFLMM